MTVDQLFDTMAVRVRSEDAGGLDVTLNMVFPEHDEPWVLGLTNRVIHYVRGRHDDDADATVTVSQRVLTEIAAARIPIADALADGTLSIDGDADAFAKIIGNLDVFMSNFKIVEP
jgi:alkyl sulfatase BDS1-like metallo-beta-lactamase superfamily hydrolase